MKVGVGWIGWSEDVTLDTSMNVIQLAYEGRIDMLKAIFGDGKSAEDPDNPYANKGNGASAVSSRPMTPELFDTLFH